MGLLASEVWGEVRIGGGNAGVCRDLGFYGPVVAVGLLQLLQPSIPLRCPVRLCLFALPPHTVSVQLRRPPHLPSSPPFPPLPHLSCVAAEQRLHHAVHGTQQDAPLAVDIGLVLGLERGGCEEEGGREKGERGEENIGCGSWNSVVTEEEVRIYTPPCLKTAYAFPALSALLNT